MASAVDAIPTDAAGNNGGGRTTPRMFRRVLTGSMAGAVLEWYDFAIYGVLAAMVLGPLFFPSDSGIASLLMALATQGLGFFARPLGGIVFGHLGDRFGRKPMLVLSRVAFVLVVYPVYLILASPAASVATIIASNAFLGFVFAIGIGPAYAFMAEAFPQSVRSSGLAILYALGVMIFGGTTQFVVAWLIDVTGNPLVPAWYQIVTTTVSIVDVLLMMPHAEVLRERAVREEVRA